MVLRPTLTTSAGAPIGDNQNSITAGPRGPLLLQDYPLIEKLAHQNRERIPERTVHAKGWGALGTLTVTHDITKYTSAKVFSQIGKKTDLIVRFSTVAGELGAADAERDVRGFAVKFYTEEGNWDLVGNNTPVFFVRDPYKFPDFIHTQKRHPRTNLRSPTAMWDFWSLSPESLHQVTILMSDRGLPQSPRFMNGYGSHTYSFINVKQERFWVKFHLKTQQGIKFHTNREAEAIVAKTRESFQEDLFGSIEKGDFPQWKLFVQIMPETEQTLVHALVVHLDSVGVIFVRTVISPETVVFSLLFDLRIAESPLTLRLLEVSEVILERGPEVLIACCGAFLVTSRIHGNASSLRLLSWRRNAASDGLSPASYCRFHSASAQLYANRAVPQALAKSFS